MRRQIFLMALLAAAILLAVQPGTAAVTPYYNNLAGFNAAAGSPPVRVTFDSIKPGTDITGTALNGITFNKGDAPAAQQIVIRASDSYTPSGFSWSDPSNVLIATSGENVLSPGGTKLAPGPDPEQKDSMALSFDTPVKAVGFDVLFQSLDGDSFVTIQIQDDHGNAIYNSGVFMPIGTAPISGRPGLNGAGSAFAGFVSDSANIKTVVITDLDDNNVNPDSNIGLDTVRADRADGPNPVPEFPSAVLPVTALAAMFALVLCVRAGRT